MSKKDLFFNRNKPLPDVYKYTDVPERLRNQIMHYWSDYVNQAAFSNELIDDAYSLMTKDISLELGILALPIKSWDSSIREDFDWFFLKERDHEHVLACIELYLRSVELLDEYNTENYGRALNYNSKSLIEDVNYRFKENGIGYYYASKQLIKMDSLILHENAVKMTLHLLSSPLFKNANEEYLHAHEHYRFGRNGAALIECLKAFETTMKIILTEKGWQYEKGDTSSKLIQALFNNNFIPSYLNNASTSLKQLLTSSIPTIRNKNSGHGQGEIKVDIPDHLVAYCLHMTGSTIRYLVEQYEATTVT